MNAVASKKQRTIQSVGSIDFTILIITVILVLLGIIMVYSSSYYTAEAKLDNPQYYFYKQILGAILGFIAMIALMNFNYKKLEKLQPFILAATLIMLLLVFTPIGVSANGSKRWINLGFTTLQPAEIAKFALIIFMSSYFSRKRNEIGSFFKGVLPMLGVVGMYCVLIMLQPNFSMVLCIGFVTIVMMFAGGVKMRHMLTMGVLGVGGAVALVFAEPYRVKRLMAFMDPFADASSSGYQLVQSYYAIAGGGLFGKGLGMSQQKLLFLPYGESDFIFSIIAEELGFIGVLAIICMYVVLLWRGIRIALTCPDRFGSLLATGVTSVIAIQTLINIGVVSGSIPPTGQPLPFISAGTSSLLIFMASVGVLLNVSRYCTKS